MNDAIDGQSDRPRPTVRFTFLRPFRILRGMSPPTDPAADDGALTHMDARFVARRTSTRNEP